MSKCQTFIDTQITANNQYLNTVSWGGLSISLDPLICCIILLTKIFADYAYSISINLLLSLSFAFCVALASALKNWCRPYWCFWRMIKIFQTIKTATPEALQHFVFYKPYRHPSCCQDRCLHVPKQSGKWKTNVVYQASFNPGKKGSSTDALRLFIPPPRWVAKCLQLSDSLICCFVWVSCHALYMNSW